MSAKTQHNNILLAVLGFAAVVIIVAVIGFFTLGTKDEVIQGEMDADEYRVSSKLPGRVVEIKVKEGDYVHVGDTLAILQVPEVDAQKRAAEATEQAAAAVSDMTDNGARQEQIHSAYQLYQQAVAARDIAKKTYDRIQNLCNEGVVTRQRRDEAYAAWKATDAQVAAAKAQYDLVKSGAREEEKRAAQKQTQAAKGAVDVVKSLLQETVQISTVEGEVTDVYPKVGELVGMGSPIMSITMLKDMWATFNVREDQLEGMRMGDTFTAYSPAFKKDLKLKVYYIKDEGSYAVWKATKSTGQYDLKTFEVRAHVANGFDGLRPGMTLVKK